MTDTTVNSTLWTISDNDVRYVVLGEEGDETVMIAGHGLADDTIREAVTHAGLGRVFNDITFNGTKIADGSTVAELEPLETWARTVRGCRRHRWAPWWLRHGANNLVGWIRWRLFRAVFAIWRRGRTPIEQLHTPRLLTWLGSHWRVFPDCGTCEIVDHHRTCEGCVWCNNTPAGKGKPPLLWTWATSDDAPADTNASRRGYQPVTVVNVRI